MYMLAIARSSRASTDREMVRRQSVGTDAQAQISAVAHREGGKVKVQMDFSVSTAAAGPEDSPQGVYTQKYVRVNGLPRRSADLVGEINAVMFTAQDLDLVYGSPSTRRRYLDILISQADPRYLKALQRYQKVLVQRNFLLKRMRDRRAQTGEMDFWDGELVTSGSYLVTKRAETLLGLGRIAFGLNTALAGEGGAALEAQYAPSFPVGRGEMEAAAEFRAALESSRPKELAAGMTMAGPHRDDVRLLLGGMDAGQYASRGQVRVLVLAMKLAEAQYLKEQRRQEPILLLDDVLSELDARRRAHVLDMAAGFQQSFITTADPEMIPEKYTARAQAYVVRKGVVERSEGVA